MVLLMTAFVDIVPVPQLVDQSPCRSTLNVMLDAIVCVLVTVTAQRVSAMNAAFVAIQLMPQPLMRPLSASPFAPPAPQKRTANTAHRKTA